MCQRFLAFLKARVFNYFAQLAKDISNHCSSGSFSPEILNHRK